MPVGRGRAGRPGLHSAVPFDRMEHTFGPGRGEEAEGVTDWDSWFTALYQENAGKMLRYAAAQLRNQPVAEELVEDAFVRLLQRKEDLVGHPNLNGWLWKTLQHLILTEVRLAKYHREVPLDPACQTPAPDLDSGRLEDVLPQGLTPGEREVLLLFYEEGLSHQEMARRLGISEMNSRTRLFRARNHCKKLLEKSSSPCHI